MYKQYLELEDRIDDLSKSWKGVEPVVVDTNGHINIDGKCFKTARLYRCWSPKLEDHAMSIDTPFTKIYDGIWGYEKSFGVIPRTVNNYLTEV